jgi:hypothetical protein
VTAVVDDAVTVIRKVSRGPRDGATFPPLRRLRFLPTVALALAAASSRAGAPPVVTRVIGPMTEQPLPNAEVIDLDSQARRFTNETGQVRWSWPDAGRLRIRVRQLGYQFVDRELIRFAPDGTPLDTLTIALRRVAYALPNVRTEATRQCEAADPATQALSMLALTQLRMAAERYEVFRKAYSFRMRQRRRTIRFLPTGVAARCGRTTKRKRPRRGASRTDLAW